MTFFMGAWVRTCASVRGALVTLFVIVSAVFSSPAWSKGDLIGTYGQWSAYQYKEAGNKVCYIVSVPTKAVGKYKRRGDIHVFVTHRPSDKVVGEFSLDTGYPFKDGSKPKVRIGGQQFNLTANGHWAWTQDSLTDKKLVLAMKRGLTMSIEGVSARGTQTRDTYALTGFTAAYRTINETCKAG